MRFLAIRKVCGTADGCCQRHIQAGSDRLRALTWHHRCQCKRLNVDGLALEYHEQRFEVERSVRSADVKLWLSSAEVRFYLLWQSTTLTSNRCAYARRSVLASPSIVSAAPAQLLLSSINSRPTSASSSACRHTVTDTNTPNDLPYLRPPSSRCAGTALTFGQFAPRSYVIFSLQTLAITRYFSLRGVSRRWCCYNR
jgi:hypothetical protein